MAVVDRLFWQLALTSVAVVVSQKCSGIEFKIKGTVTTVPWDRKKWPL